MDHEVYPTKIIDHFLNDIKTSLIKMETSTANSIDALAEKIGTHNGRLSKVEQFMWAFGGGMGVITILILPYLFYYLTTIQAKVDRIDKTLSQYNVEIR